MALENKLGITDSSALAREEEKIRKNNNFVEPKATISEVVHLKTL